MDARAAIACAGMGVLGYVCLEFFESDIGDGKVMRIFRQKITPGTEYNVKVFRDDAPGIHVLIDDVELLCEAEKAGVRALPGDANHHPKVFRVRNVAGAMKAEEARCEGGDGDVALEALGILSPDIEVLSEQIADMGEREPSLAGVALFRAPGSCVAGDHRGQVDRRDCWSEFADAVGNMNMAYNNYIPPYFMSGLKRMISSIALSLATSCRSM